MNLVNHVAHLWNTLYEKQPTQFRSRLSLSTVLPRVCSEEVFGLVPSQHTSSYGGLLEIKEEPDADSGMDATLLEVDARASEAGEVPAVTPISAKPAKQTQEASLGPKSKAPEKRKAPETSTTENSLTGPGFSLNQSTNPPTKKQCVESLRPDLGRAMVEILEDNTISQVSYGNLKPKFTTLTHMATIVVTGNNNGL